MPPFIRPYSLSERNHALGLSTETQCHIMQPIKQSTTSILDLLSTTQQTSSSGSDETSLLTLCSVTGDGRGFTNMLMVTTTVRMVDGIHSNTTSLWPGVTLNCELVLRPRCLQERLVRTSTTCNDANHSTDRALNNLLCARWELDAGLTLVWVVSNDGTVVAAGASKLWDGQ